MIEFLLPHTDAGVLAQLILVTTLGFTGIWFARKNREIQIFAVGVLVFLWALMAIRTVH